MLERSFENGEDPVILKQGSGLCDRRLSLTESRFHEYATTKALLRQDSNLGSHIQDRLHRRVRRGSQRGLMNFQIEPPVTLHS